MEPTAVIMERTSAIMEPTATIMEPTDAIMEPTAVIMEPTAAIIDPTAVIMEPTATILDPSAVIMEPTTLLYFANNKRCYKKNQTFLSVSKVSVKKRGRCRGFVQQPLSYCMQCTVLVRTSYIPFM